MALDKRSLLSNLSVAFLAQGISFVLSLTTSLFVPKVLGVEQFGYWQLFIFYSGYSGTFLLGLNDGFYLVHGGKDRSELDAGEVKGQFVFGLLFQCLFAAVIFILAFLDFFGPQRDFVLIATAIYILLNNATVYLGYVFQAVNETKLFSYSVMISKVAFLLPLAALLVVGVTDFQLYVVSFILAQAAALLYCVWQGRDFFRAPLPPALQASKDAFGYIRVGMKLMLANTASMLILGAMRFEIDAAWGIAKFGELSFSLSMVNFFLVFITQASMVLFPALRRTTKAELVDFYYKVKDCLGLLLPATYIFYFPMKWILEIWLPQYASSLFFFAFLIPICVFDGKMKLVGTTYFKVMRLEGLLLAINVVAVAASLVLSWVGINIFESAEVVVGLVVGIVAARSIYTEWYLMKTFGNVEWSVSFAEIGLTVLFVAMALNLPEVLALLLYACAYLLVVFGLRKKLYIPNSFRRLIPGVSSRERHD